MKEFHIYKDIRQRTNGEIYLGVVGPVRTGKSTFIRRFMDEMVIPHMEDGPAKTRSKDELPQAVKEAAIASARLKLKTLFFIIDSSSGTCYHDNRSTLCRVAVKRLKIILNYREFVSKCQANLFFNEKIVAVWLCSARTATTRAGVPLRNGGSD